LKTTRGGLKKGGVYHPTRRKKKELCGKPKEGEVPNVGGMLGEPIKGRIELGGGGESCDRLDPFT